METLIFVAMGALILGGAVYARYKALKSMAVARVMPRRASRN